MHANEKDNTSRESAQRFRLWTTLQRNSEAGFAVSAWLFTLAFVLRSRPFLQLPYDMWHHLMLIRGWYQDGTPILTRPGVSYHEVGWHWAWAQLFRLMHIDDVFVWAKIIHCVQFFWAIIAAFFLVRVCLRIFIPTLSRARVHLLGLMGALLFIVGVGTFSVQHQLAWILWYSVNYQGFTLPAYLVMLALTLRLIVDTPRGALMVASLTLAVLGLLALDVALHPLEASYYLVNFVLLAAIFPDRFLGFFRRHTVIFSLFVGGVLASPLLLHLLPLWGVPLPATTGFSQLLDVRAFFSRAMAVGGFVQEHDYHRGFSTLCEYIFAGMLLCVIIFAGEAALLTRNRALWSSLRLRLAAWLTVASFFFALAPRIQLLSGLLSLMLGPSGYLVVFRFSYAGPWFVAFAVIGGWILQGLPAWPAHYRWLVVLSPALLTLCVSRFVIHGPANTDTASVFRSLEIRARDSVGIQFDRRQLLALNNRIKQAPPPPPGKRNIFLIRADLQSYARAATGVYVLGDRLNAVSKSLYDTWPERNDYQLVTIDLPADFPVDQEMRRAFPEMAL